MSETKWEPQPSDVRWIQEMIRILQDGGTWAVPCSQSTFTFLKSKKKYRFDGNREHETNLRTFKILRSLGWQEDTVDA